MDSARRHLKEFSNLFLTIFYSITCALSIIANLTLIFIKSLRKVLPLHMVMSDFIFTLSLPFWAVYASSEWIFGDQSCKAITLVLWTFYVLFLPSGSSTVQRGIVSCAFWCGFYQFWLLLFIA